MRYFIDTEFIETGGARHPTIDLISIGIVCEDGREYYVISNEFDEFTASPWVVENVIEKLPMRVAPVWASRAAIRQGILDFIEGEPEFWGYYADYDWVVFCWIFGNMIDLPKGWPKYCRDLKQMADMCGGVKFPQPDKSKEHNALDDARWNRDMFAYLIEKADSFRSLVKREQARSKS